MMNVAPLLRHSLVVSVLLLASILHAAESTAISDGLITLEKEMARDPRSANQASLLIPLREAFAQDNYGEANRLLGMIDTAAWAQTSPAKATVAKLRLELQAAVKRQTAGLDAVIADIQAKFRARAPATDFDPILQQLVSLGAALQGAYEFDPLAARKLEAAQAFVTGWQAYLADLQTKNFADALASARQLADQTESSAIVPRAELLGLQNEVQTAQTNGDRQQVTESRALLKTFVPRIQALVDKSSDPAEFENLDSELEEAQRRGLLQPDYEIASEFIVLWQRYLNLVETKNTTGARQTLEQLANPRFELILTPARLKALREGRDIRLKAAPTTKAKP